MIGAIMNRKPVILNDYGGLLRTLGSSDAASCVVEKTNAIVCQSDGTVKLYNVQGNLLRQYPLPSPEKATTASLSNGTVIIPTFTGKTFTFTLTGQPLRVF